MGRWEKPAQAVAAELPERMGARLLVGCCFHNRSFRLFRALAETIRPDLVVNLGDLSGVGGPVERIELAGLAPFWRLRRAPEIYVPGNHDSRATVAAMRRRGAVVFDRPRLVPIPLVHAGILRVWSWPNPSRSTFGGAPYDPALVRAEAVKEDNRPPVGDGPYVVAVHASGQVVDPPPEVRLVLCGHAHEPKIWRRGHITYARCGTSGGGGIGYHGEREFLVADVRLPEHEPAGLWTVVVADRTEDVEAGAAGPRDVVTVRAE